MATQIARYAKVDMVAATATGHLTLLTDQSRDAVFLKGRVRCGPAFSKVMLVLGRIVKMSARATEKDHSAYQEWVYGQYLKEVDSTHAKRLKGLPKLSECEATLADAIRSLQREISEASEQLDTSKDLYKFYDWLYEHNREAWIQLDPIVSVQDDATFFEGFSVDESVYGRVRLAHKSLDLSEAIKPGTTNIDFSIPLEREFSRIRTYRPLDLTVGAQAVQIETEVGAAIEKKIDLPDSWVRGLVEVQSALMLSPVTLRLSPAFVADIVARLEAEKEKHGPRSVKFRLTPNEPVSVEIEPWGTVVVDHSSNYTGSRPEEIRVWGRRRLLILKDVLPDATSLDVRLLGSGMPSFWTVHVDEVELTIGLSGWTALDWAGRARFSALMPSADVSTQLMTQAAALLKSSGRISPAQLAGTADVNETEARGALQKLCMLGKAMFDPDTASFRWRELYPEFDLTKLSAPALEERKGIELHVSGAVSIQTDCVENGNRIRVATVSDSTERTTTIETDPDGRVTYAECTCGHFRANKLREGPCRHIVALSLS
jgi:hypothetical protein